jgi:hypothetical protein
LGWYSAEIPIIPETRAYKKRQSRKAVLGPNKHYLFPCYACVSVVTTRCGRMHSQESGAGGTPWYKATGTLSHVNEIIQKMGGSATSRITGSSVSGFEKNWPGSDHGI